MAKKERKEVYYQRDDFADNTGFDSRINEELRRPNSSFKRNKNFEISQRLPLTKHIRLIPRNIMKDKEALYDDTIQLKRNQNFLINENQILKSKIQQFEEELRRKEKMMNGLLLQMGSLSSMKGIQSIQNQVRIYLILDTFDWFTSTKAKTSRLYY